MNTTNCANVNLWKRISSQNGIETYKNTETGELDVIDCYEKPTEFDF